MIRYRLRKDRIVNEKNIKYIAYGIDVYKGLRKLKSIKDISLDKKQLAKQIKMWNRYRVGLVHIEEIVEDFVINDITMACNIKKNRI